MAFNARITIAGLCLILRDRDQDTSQVEVILLDTEDRSSSPAHHRHHGQEHLHSPLLALPYGSRGNLKFPGTHELEGWETYTIAPNGDAFARLSLNDTVARFDATWEDREPEHFSLDSTVSGLPDLRKLGVQRVRRPGWNHCLNGATSRISLPRGRLEMSGVAVDSEGKPLLWEGIGAIAEFLHLQLTGLTELRFDYGTNDFKIIAPPTDDLLVSLTNEPNTPPTSMFDSVTGRIVAPHFGMLGRLTDSPPQLTRTGDVTPSNPICPVGGWVESDWSFLPRS